MSASDIELHRCCLLALLRLGGGPPRWRWAEGGDQGRQVRDFPRGVQDVRGGGDELAGQAQPGADDGAVQAAGRVQAVPQDGGRGAGGRAHLVADDGSADGQRLVQGADAAVERDQRDWFGALGQRDARPGGQVLHGGDAGHGLHRHLGDQVADGLGQVAERGVQVGVAEGAERDRGRARGELRRHRGRGGLPGRRPARRDAAGVVERELQALDPVSAHVGADDRLGPPWTRILGLGWLGLGWLGLGWLGLGWLGGQHGDQHHIGLAQHADRLDRDQFRVPGSDAHSDQALHGVGTLPQAAAVNLAAAAG